MTSALARYLKDFGDPQPHQQPMLTDFGNEPSFSDDFPEFPASVEMDAPDLEAVRQEAYAEGYETALAEFNLKHEEALEALRQAHAEELQRIQKTHEEQTASRIAEALKSIAAELAERVSDEVAHCLAPLLQASIARKAVADMSELLRDAVLEGDAGPIIVKGPLSLFNILATELGEDAVLLRHIEAADLDLTVEIAGSVLVTRMSAFAASLKKVLE